MSARWIAPALAVVGVFVVAACDRPAVGTAPVVSPVVSPVPAAPAAAPVAAPAVVPVPVSDEALLTGALPAGPERDLALSRCAICHSEQYLSQQRLTPAQWKKTVDKMRGWGAPLSDDEAAVLAVWLGRHYPPELAERRSLVSPAPAGAVDP